MRHIPIFLHVDRNAEIVQQGPAAEDGALAIDATATTPNPGRSCRSPGGLRHDSARERFSHDRARRNRMQRAKAAARGNSEERRFDQFAAGRSTVTGWRAHRHGSSFIENQRVDLRRAFQKIRTLDENPQPGSHRHRGNDGGRAGYYQGCRSGDNQHRDCAGEILSKEEDGRGDGDYERQPDSRAAFKQPQERNRGPLYIGEQRNYASQDGVRARLSNLDFQQAIDGNGSRKNLWTTRTHIFMERARR